MAKQKGKPEGQPSGDVIKILGKRVFGRKDCMPGAIVRVGETVTVEQALWAIDNGLACWLGDAKGELEASERRRIGAQKAAAESTMQRFDLMDPEDRELAREHNPEEGSDVT